MSLNSLMTDAVSGVSAAPSKSVWSGRCGGSYGVGTYVLAPFPLAVPMTGTVGPGSFQALKLETVSGRGEELPLPLPPPTSLLPLPVTLRWLLKKSRSARNLSWNHFPLPPATSEAASNRTPLTPALTNVPGLMENEPVKKSFVNASANISAWPSLTKAWGSSKISFHTGLSLKKSFINGRVTWEKTSLKAPASAPATADCPISFQSKLVRRRSSSGRVIEMTCAENVMNASWTASSSAESGVGTACPILCTISSMDSAVRDRTRAISASDVPPVNTANAAIRASSRFMKMNSRRIWYLPSASWIERSTCRRPMSRSSLEKLARWF
ncbi:hypothetical protein GCM10012282_14840 [Streptomyces lacrimifluminis]|uniref:Uncharacterized protein n=1 Tax=Streptomyces lacrimifluminis TaxID=1500077 RepID=A0A917KLM0_9ACTN|nr:hypothetical protein GCM10012282_14840 [Streptomyces lacrimifluminis]